MSVYLSLRRLAGIALFLGCTASAAADNLAGAYSAILRGDVKGGQDQLATLRKQPADADQVQRVSGWLDKYTTVTGSREELNSMTLAWNVDHAKTELAKGAGANLYLALTFAARGVAYTGDEAGYRREPWVVEISNRCRDEAKKLIDAGSWSKSHAYYLALERIHGEDSEYKPLREEAARHLRLDILYEDREALDRRIADVTQEILASSLRTINDYHYEKPDFKKLAGGALKYLRSMSDSKKIQKYLDGLAVEDSRAIFKRKLDELESAIAREERYSFRDVWNLWGEVRKINESTIEVPEGLLIVEFTEGFLNELDEFTSMVWPADAVEFDKLMMGGFEGVGIQLGVDEATGRLKVVTPLENSPALEAGIQPEDLIVEVDTKTTKGWSTDDAVRNIMGPAGTKVTLTMFRPDTGEYLKFDLNRRNIILKTVRGYERKADSRGEWNFLADPAEGIAYIRLSGFHPDSDAELRAALKSAQAQGMKALILDLRYNPGGLLEVAVDTVSAFVRSGDVASTRGRADNERERQKNVVNGRVFSAELPLVVLVNDSSASASEILAGALQDHERAMVIGQRTFGKGSVQRVFPLARSLARLKLTTALYYLPDGRSPHRAPGAEVWGVEPDLAVNATPKDEREVIRRQNQALVINNGRNSATSKPVLSEAALKELKDSEKKADDDDADTPLLSEAEIELLNSDPYDPVQVDPQLEMALLQLRVKLAGGLPWPTKMAAANKPDNGG